MKSVTLAIVFVLASAQFVAAEARREREFVSIVNLISNPDDYHGKVVVITGFLSLDFEGSGIYLHQDDYEYGITKNGLWCVIDLEKYRASDHSYVGIEGVFNAKAKGHLGMWSGTIENVKRVWKPIRRAAQ